MGWFGKKKAPVEAAPEESEPEEPGELEELEEADIEQHGRAPRRGRGGAAAEHC